MTRRETRRRVLVAAREEFAAHGYRGATVARIADRADVAVQTLYSSWGGKRALLRAVLETAVTGTDEGFVTAETPPLALADPSAEVTDPRAFLIAFAHRFRLLSERAASAWRAYRDGAGSDPELAEDWARLMSLRRKDFHLMLAALPPQELRPGLSPAAAADTAWTIASPASYELLVTHAGFDLDQFEAWVASTLIAALLPDAASRS